MARLMVRYKAEMPKLHAKHGAVTGETMVESVMTSRADSSSENITAVTTRLFEDGSGILNFKRGPEDITIRWSEEENDTFEIHADFNGIEGTLVPTKVPVQVPGASDGN